VGQAEECCCPKEVGHPEESDWSQADEPCYAEEAIGDDESTVGSEEEVGLAEMALVLRMDDVVSQNSAMVMPLRFVDDDYTPRLWAELYPVLRNIKTDDLVLKMLAYKKKPLATWRPDDWGLLDALNHMLTLRASSKGHQLQNDSPRLKDAAFWAKLDQDLTFYYEAEYPGPELADE
jgi:hypothetical protein